MAQNENTLPVTKPADLRNTGHVLLVRQSDVLNRIRLALHQKKYRSHLSIGVFDFTSEQRLAQTSEDEDEDGPWSILYHVTNVDIARKALEELDLAFSYRKDTPSAPGTWILLIDGLATDNWEIFQEYLKDGKDARMYIIAATSEAAGPWRTAFDTIIEA